MNDTEQTYRDWTLDVYQSTIDGCWHVDYWHRGGCVARAVLGNYAKGRKRKDVIAEAKRLIDKTETLLATTHA